MLLTSHSETGKTFLFVARGLDVKNSNSMENSLCRDSMVRAFEAVAWHLSLLAVVFVVFWGLNI